VEHTTSRGHEHGLYVGRADVDPNESPCGTTPMGWHASIIAQAKVHRGPSAQTDRRRLNYERTAAGRELAGARVGAGLHRGGRN
jgi:hypothetical protein